ncbi:PepSY-like domain-containing protein [Flavobacterium wongokense]|uniref:PepSY-like domain-containing protein n=1 Tax=Flavobacterium wongokense TaxID=2910674 RepID=UPI001F1CD97D|nr:PepSY-like domain-containing protein [Flavobacterium sp. WG47]MCF6132985.1 PepSY-like domain-containing protein [Flavobacterium sp. WG47]
METKNIFAFLLLFAAMTMSAQKKIDPSELPPASINFLREHFPSTTVTKAKKDAEHGEKGYEVILSDGTEVEFWKDGKWREVDGKDNPIPTAYIDRKIVDYVAKNYPKNKITHIDYGHKDVDVDLTGKIDLEFTKEGTFIK